MRKYSKSPAVYDATKIAFYSYAGPEAVRFTDAGLQNLSFECEAWNPAGESRFWVSVPRVCGTETVIRPYMRAASL